MTDKNCDPGATPTDSEVAHFQSGVRTGRVRFAVGVLLMLTNNELQSVRSEMAARKWKS